MDFLIRSQALLLTLPFLVIILPGERRIPFNLIPAAVVAFAVFLHLLARSKDFSTRTKENRWLLLFFGFQLVGAISLSVSPYRAAAWPKGLLQIIGLLAMIGMALGLTRLIKSDPAFVLRLLRAPLSVLAVLAAIGLVQFVAWNFLGRSSATFLNFSFLNEIVGGAVWRNPGLAGGLHRANSLFDEPAHFAQFLGLGLGVALVRLGLLGRIYSASIASVVPRWVAICLVAGPLVSLSLVGFALLLVTAGATALACHKIGSKLFAISAVAVVFLALPLLVLTRTAGPRFLEKLRSPQIIPTAGRGGQTLGSQDVSAAVLASHFTTMQESFARRPLLGVGLGAHPELYADNVPLFVQGSPLGQLNLEDAGSLFIRLLSETGLMGFVLFVSGWTTVVARSRRALISHWGDRKIALEPPNEKEVELNPLPALAAGITGSCIGIFVVYLIRWGVYYDGVLWLLMALTASVPRLLRTGPSLTRTESDPSFGSTDDMPGRGSLRIVTTGQSVWRSS